MKTEILNLIEVALWSGIAAVGFGILFNIPRRAILTVFVLGFSAGFIKFLLLHQHHNVVLASLIAALFVGILSTPLAHRIHHPPVVFSIPAIIPMIPGYFAYETILAIMKFTFLEPNASNKTEIINEMFTNGFNMIFILICLAIGVSFPILFLKKTTVKNAD